MMLRLPRGWQAEVTAAPVPMLLGGAPWERRGTIGFRLLPPSGKRAPATTVGRMPREFTATILLEENWDLDIEAIAATTVTRFPTIGRIGVQPVSPGAPGAVTVDGAAVTLRQLPGPVPPDQLNPPLKTLRAWDPGSAIRHHVGAIEISCGGDLPGLEGAEAYAAAVHFVATAACRVAPVSAVLWSQGRAVTEPGTFGDCAERILEGRMPLGAWISFAPIVPDGFQPQDATGMVTYGLGAFIGRELELAPCPGGPRHAWRCISRIARMALDRGVVLRDRQRLSEPAGEFAVTVRECDSWARRDQPAFVLVTDDSVVDVERLQPRPHVD